MGILNAKGERQLLAVQERSGSNQADDPRGLVSNRPMTRQPNNVTYKEGDEDYVIDKTDGI